jgi:hypothetical protein
LRLSWVGIKGRDGGGEGEPLGVRDAAKGKAICSEGDNKRRDRKAERQESRLTERNMDGVFGQMIRILESRKGSPVGKSERGGRKKGLFS